MGHTLQLAFSLEGIISFLDLSYGNAPGLLGATCLWDENKKYLGRAWERANRNYKS